MFLSLYSSLVKSTAICSRVVSPTTAISVRNKARDTQKEQRRAKDRADMKWVQPLVEYNAEKASTANAPPQEPHMLHVVWRTKNLQGRPWWEKEIMKALGLDGKKRHPTVHKNTPEINRQLAEVKHLVKILPVKFPHGFPDNPADYEHTVMKTNGEYLVAKRLEVPESVPLVEAVDSGTKGSKWAMSEKTVKNELDRQRLQYAIHMEYVDAEYNYTRNQDGKEHRYNFSKPEKM